jgi:protein transport protein SEC24
LILPEGFKLLPLYLLGLFKSKALKSNSLLFGQWSGCKLTYLHPAGVNISSDIRAAHVYQLLSRGVASTISYIYPRLIAFHDLEDAAGFDSPHTGRFLMPAPLPSSYIWMEAHGAYLIGQSFESPVQKSPFNTDDTLEITAISRSYGWVLAYLLKFF